MRWWRWNERDEDLQRELRAHLDLESAEQMERGLPPKQAHAAARRVLGNIGSIRETTREVWGGGTMERLLQDLRYALRVMAGQSLFTAMAVLSLALGIGANTAIFSFMDAILLRSLPVQNPSSLVVLNWRSKDHPALVHSMNGSLLKDPKAGFTSGNFPYSAFTLLHSNSPVFSSVFAFFGAGQLNLLIHGRADLANGQYVSGEYFSGLGIPPAAGRLIDSSDDQVGAPPLVILGFAYAQRRFSSISSAVGQSIQINNVSFTVAGVAGPEFFGVNPAGPQDVYVPMHTSLLIQPLPAADNPNRLYVDNNFYWVQMMARLRPGITREQAQAASAPAFQHLVESAAVNARERADLPVLSVQDGAGGLDFLRRQYSKPLYVLMTMVALILALACINVANLLLARAAARQREIGLRLSLGASRFRVVRQLLTESVLLSLLGGVAGLLFATWGIHAMTALIGNGREDFTLNATLNGRVLAVTGLLSLLTGVLFGLAPAMQSMGVDLIGTLRQTRVGRRRWRLAVWLPINPSHALVVSQISISLLLLTSAAVFVRTLTNLNSVTLGFNGEHVLLFTVDAKQVGYRDDALIRFYEDLQTRLSAIPGVRGVSSSSQPLVSGAENNTRVTIPGFVGKAPSTSFLYVGPAFFTTMQIPILLGREVDERDVRTGVPVAVVNEEFVKTFLPGQSPIGRRFEMGARGSVGEIEVVGVSRNARYSSLKQAIPPVAYLPYSQNLMALNRMCYELRAAGNPLSLVQAVRQVLSQADVRVPASGIVTQADRIDQTISQERTFATLCGCFALLAVAMACVGLYGTMAYNVARRTNEIGIRMALGAERRSVVWMVLREVLAMTATGLGIGLAVTAVTSRVLESFVFQVKPNDPSTLALAALTLLTAAMFAGYGPARRASRIDPWTALRDE